MWGYAIWGMAGGLAIEGAEILRAKHRGTQPWTLFGPGIYAVRVIIRMVLGGSITAALGSSGRIANDFMAMMTGASAPLLLEKVSQIAKIVLPEREGVQPDRSVTETKQIMISPAKVVDNVAREKVSDAN